MGKTLPVISEAMSVDKKAPKRRDLHLDQIKRILKFMKGMKGKALAACPIAAAASMVGDMWTILITRDLLAGARRFSELQHSIISAISSKSINSRTLTNRLKLLESQNIISRAVFHHEMPPRVEYALTKKGKELSSLIEQLRKFGEKNLMK